LDTETPEVDASEPTDTQQEADTSDLGTADGADVPLDTFRPDALIDVGWNPVVSSNPLVTSTVEASRAGLTAFCDCCAVQRFASDTAACLTTAAGGGFEPDDCELAAFETMATDADGYLECLTGAFEELLVCGTECGGFCSLCENNFQFAKTSCGNTHPSVVEQLARCAE